MRRRGVARVWLADDEGVGARVLLDHLTARLKATGIEVVDREGLNPRGEVPDDIAEDVRDDRADAFVYAGSYRPFALEVLRAVHAGAPRVALFAADGVTLGPDLAARAGAAADRLLLTGIAPARDAGFAERFRARYGTDPDRRAVLGYQAMQLVLGAIERAGSDAASRPAVIREALRMAGEPVAGFATFRIANGRLVRAPSDL
jgi:branched-chain amino acid transport system substrate-binding protein